MESIIKQVAIMIVAAWKVFEEMKTNDPDKLTDFYNDNLNMIFDIGGLFIECEYLCTLNKEWYNYYIDLLGIDAEKFDIKNEMIF